VGRGWWGSSRRYGLLTQNAFLMGLFPLLIVKDREMERF
jgi:hypothetical protein